MNVLALRCLDRDRDAVDAYGLSTSPRKLGCVLATATTEVESPSKGGALGLLAIEQRRDPCCGGLGVSLPGSDPEAIHERIIRHGWSPGVKDTITLGRLITGGADEVLGSVRMTRVIQ